MDQVGINWNIILAPELSNDATRDALRSGAFYVVSRVARREGVNAYMDGLPMPYAGGSATAVADHLFNAPNANETPGFNSITVSPNGTGITVDGRNFHTIQWIGDYSNVIYTGTTFNILEHRNNPYLNSFVRVQLIGDVGIAISQPFGVSNQHNQCVCYTVITQPGGPPTIILRDGTYFISGDINGDGAVNITDVIMLLQYLSGRITLTATGRLAADVNRNGSVDVTDVIYMLQWLNGYPFVLSPPR